MLFEFGFKNFLAFKEGAAISFRLDANCPDSVSRGKDFATAICVKGANASGKTNVLRALSFLSTFCAKSFSEPADGKIAAIPHFDSEEPIEFYADFQIGKIEYRYELELNESEVIREAVYRKKAKSVLVCERKLEKITFTTKKFERLASMVVRKNASIISTAKQYGFAELLEVHTFFAAMITNVGFAGMVETLPDESAMAKFLEENPDYLEFVKTFLIECDVGITDFEIFKVPAENKDGDRFFPVFHHGQKHDRPVFRQTESSGTRALFRMMAAHKWVLEMGGIMIHDEIDNHLHPMLLAKILNLFLNDKSNPNSAQILFTTHSEEIMNLMGRYRVYLVNKENNESYAYRLDEIPGTILRNDRPVLPAYKEGKIGGIPRL